MITWIFESNGHEHVFELNFFLVITHSMSYLYIYLPLLFDVPCCCILTNAPSSPKLVLDGSEQTQADALSCLCSVTIVVVMLLPAISIEPTMADDDVVVFVLHDDDDDDDSFGFLRGGWSSSQEVPVDAIEFVSLSILMMKIMPKNKFANNFCSPFHNAHKTQFQYFVRAHTNTNVQTH